MKDLKEKAIKGFLWTGSGKFAEQVIRWTISIVLARLLAPSDYGLMALTSLYIIFINYFEELGIGSAIINKKEIQEVDLNTAFWLNITMSIVIYGLTFILSDYIALFFNQPKLSEILKISGLSIIVMALGIVPASVVARDLKFNVTAKVAFISNISMSVISLALAFNGFGIWSLVIGSITKNMFYSLLLFYFSSWKPKLAISLKSARQLLSFGLPLLGSKSLHTFYYNSDNLVVGKVLGEQMLGYYYMAFHLSTMLTDKLSIILNDVNVPILSKLQDDNQRFKNYLLQTTKYISLIFFPLLVGLALVADDFVSVVLGEKWIPIVLLLQLFCIIGVFKSINSIIAPILISKGRTDLNFKYNLISAILLPVSFLLGVQFGLKGIAIAWIVSYPLLTVYLLEIGLNEIGLTFGEYMKSLLPALKATIFMMGIILFFQLLKYDNKTVMLIGSISAGVLSYIMFFAAIQKDTLVEAKEIFISMKKTKISKLINKG